MRSKILRSLLLLAFAVSAALNVKLFRDLVGQIHEKFEIQLDPTSDRRFREANRTLEPKAKGTVRVVFVGDSHIERWTELPRVKGMEAINRGCSGETTAQTSMRLERDVLDLAPDVAVIALGSNDTKCVGLFPGEGDRIAATCQANLLSFVDRLVQKNVRVVFLTLFPVGDADMKHRLVWSEAARGAMIDAQTAMNKAFRERSSPGLTVVDCDAVLAKDGRLNPALTSDGTHLNVEGYRALDSVVTPVLERVVASLR